MLDPAKNNFGLVAGNRFTQLLKEYLGDVEIDQLQYPFYIGDPPPGAPKIPPSPKIL